MMASAVFVNSLGTGRWLARPAAAAGEVAAVAAAAAAGAAGAAKGLIALAAVLETTARLETRMELMSRE